MQTMKKPPFQVPLMSEVAKLPWNGYRVASTFSGGGGSCTGYRMAGYRVLWANEFVPIAQESYKANHPGSILDGRDIKKVTAEEILEATGLKRGELDIFDGSPPCQAFSTAGKREKGWASNGGKAKRYDHGDEQHNELLFYEYVRLLEGLQPKVFIAENVKGLTIGEAKNLMGDGQVGMFGGQEFESRDGKRVKEIAHEDTIVARLIAAGYVVDWQVLDAKDYGVPQTRNRVIFMGVRRDIAEAHGLRPSFPKPLGYVYTVRDALPWIVGKVAVGNERFESVFGEPDVPSPTIMAGGLGKTSGLVVEPRPEEVQALPPSRQPGAYGYAEVDPEKPCPTVTCASPGNDLAVPVVTNRQRGDKPPVQVDIDGPAPTVMSNRGRKDTQFEVRVPVGAVHETGVAFCGGDETDRPAFAVTCSPGQHKIVEDVRRDLAENPNLRTPKSGSGGYGKGGPTIDGDRPCEAVLAGGIGGVGHGQYDVESEKLEITQQQGGAFNAKVSVDKPAPCVCASQPSRFVIKGGGRQDPDTGASLELDASRLKVCDGTQEFGSAGAAAHADKPSPPVLTPSNSVVHAIEKRKFTIPEVKRICAFPDDYVLVGSYAKQWERCGNSVPPVFMFHIANHVRKNILDRIPKP